MRSRNVKFEIVFGVRWAESLSFFAKVRAQCCYALCFSSDQNWLREISRNFIRLKNNAAETSYKEI